MERFNTEGIDFAFPTQTLHIAGDDKRPLTVGQRWVSKEETFSPSAILAQATALSAQAAQITPTPASDSVRPQARKAEESKLKVESEATTPRRGSKLEVRCSRMFSAQRSSLDTCPYGIYAGYEQFFVGWVEVRNPKIPARFNLTYPQTGRFVHY